MMKFTPRGLLLSALWLLPLAIGLLIGRQMNTNTGALTPGAHKSPTAQETGSRTATLRESSLSEKAAGKNSPSRLSGSSEERIEQARMKLADILNTSGRVDRMREMLAFIDQLDPADMEGVIAGFRESGWVDYNRGEFSMLLSAWMDQAPFDAIAYLDKSEPDGWTRKTAIAAWASQNPEAAAEAIKGLEDEGRVNDWVVGLVQGIARNDPEAALLTLQELPADETRKQAIRSILPEVISRGTDFAGEWVEQISDNGLQRDTARRLARPLAQRDPEAAAEWIRGMGTTETRRDASEVVGGIFAAKDLDAARVWAESLPHDTMTEAAEGVARHMARKDPAETAQWLRKLGDDPDLDGARIQFLRESSRRDPEVALENVSTLSKPGDQSRYYRDILRTWSRSDKEAAVTWAIEHAESIPKRVYQSIVPKDRRPQ